MKLVLCTTCDGGALYSEEYPCGQCEDMEVYHIVDAAVQEYHVIVPCGCPSCSVPDAKEAT